jgi:hypothetical protein
MSAGSAVVIGSEKTAENGLEAETGEHVAGDIVDIGLLHFLIGFVGDVYAFFVGDGEELGLAFGGVSHELEIGISPAVKVVGLTFRIDGGAREEIETIRVCDRKRAQEESVNETKSGGAGADGKSKREYCGNAGDFIFGELAKAENGVGAEGVQPREEMEIAEGFFCLFKASEFEEGVFASSFGGHSFGEVVVNEELEVRGEFNVEIAVDLGFAEEIFDASEEGDHWVTSKEVISRKPLAVRQKNVGRGWESLSRCCVVDLTRSQDPSAALGMRKVQGWVMRRWRWRG